MASKDNYLGKFGDLTAVWNMHPEGGREGDYIVIGTREYVWNNLARQWQVQPASGGGSASGESIDGDLNVSGDLNVGGDATIAGTLHVGNIEVEGERFKGQSSYTSFVFTRSESQPATPLGGSFDDPYPDGILWHDSVPQGTQSIWMSSRVFTSDGKAPQQAEWSTPRKMVDDESTDIEFSPASVDAVPEDPSDSNRGRLWFDPTEHSAQWSNMNWMAIATKSYDANGNVVYGPWTKTPIKGERGADGPGFQNIFYRTKLFVMPLPNVATGSAYQSDTYLPGVGNKATCDGEGNAFTDDPRGVSETWPYEWMLTRKKVNGQWQAYRNAGLINNPVLFATFSKNHDVYINEAGYWVIDGVTTDKKAVGTGVTIKGRVDVYSDDEIVGTQRSLESYPSSLQGDDALAVGDCWIVTSGTDGDNQDVSGHLFICIALLGSDIEDMWQDLGEFKGESGDNGVSSYLYLAWAKNVLFSSGSPSQVDTFTTDPGEGQTYGWMGILISNEQIAQENLAQHKLSFKWNYLRGMDGVDYEHVYIRTKIDTAPTIDHECVEAQGYQDPEFKPDVHNINDFAFVEGGSNNTIEGSQFTDDPNGISEEWPYEWQARRDKVNGQWQAFSSPAILHRNWAEPGADGDDGKDAAIVEVNNSMLVVDADNGGKIASPLTLTLNCWLKVGGVKKSITSVTAYYGDTALSRNPITGSGYTVNHEGGVQSARLVVTIKLASGVELATKNISVTLGDGENEASATVPVTIVRRGAKGDDGLKGNVGPVLRLCGAWNDTDTYEWNDNFRDCVKHEGVYWMVADYGDELTDVEPDEQDDHWVYLGNMQFIATELLLAENATIQLLNSNRLIFTNANGKKTAGINEDGQGSYVTYYTESPYGKRKDDNADGWTYYYNNDADNTLAWMLGPSGVIIRTGSVITMQRIRFSSSPVGNTPTFNPDSNLYEIVDRWVYTNEDSTINGTVYSDDSLDRNHEPNPLYIVGDGTYAQASAWAHRYNKDNDRYEYYLPLIRIQNNMVKNRWDATYTDPNDPLNS